VEKVTHVMLNEKNVIIMTLLSLSIESAPWERELIYNDADTSPNDDMIKQLI